MNFLRNLIQGTQSASKTDSGQKKKGAPAPPGSGGPDDIQSKEDTSAQAEVCVTQPSSPSLPPANFSSPSLTKESESTSATEETSFASCLTEEASALSECCVLPSQDVTPASEASCAPVGAHQADPLSNSVSDSVAQNITQNGVKKDSEYESAEELESPSGSTAVVEEPASTSANIVTNQAQSARPGPDTPVLTRDANGVEDKDETRKAEVAEETGSHVIQGTVNGHIESDQKEIVNTISDSVVTVTKSEIIEESIQVLPEVKKTETVELPNHQGESRIVTTETVGTNGNLSEVHGRLSSTAENSHEESKNKEIICNGDKTSSEEVTDNQISCGQVIDEQNNSIPVHESTTETANKEPDEINSSALPVSSEDPEEIPILPKKAYNLDFLDNLDDPNFNPFTTKSSVSNTPPPSPEPGRKPLKPAIKKKKPENKRSEILKKESPPDEIKCEQEQKTEKTEGSKPLNQDIEQEAVPIVTNSESAETNKVQALEIAFEDTPKVVTKPPRTLGIKTQLKPKVKAPIEKNNNTVVKSDIPETEVKTEPEEDLPIPPSKGYNLDFLDKLDDPNFNPFQTKTTVSNSPPKEGFVVSDDKSEQDNKPKPKVVSPKKSPAKKGFSVVKNKTKTEKSPVKPGDEVDSAKQPKTSVTDQSANNQSETESQEDTVEVPKKGYNLDFLDDPNFDPFQTRSPVEVLAPEDGKPVTPVNSSEVVQEKPSPPEVKPAEELLESESHKEERLGAEGSEEPSINVPNKVQNQEETELQSKSENCEEKQAEEQESIGNSQSLKVSSSQLPEEKPNSVDEQVEISAEVQVVEEKNEISDVKPQVAVVRPQVAEVKPLVQDLPVEKDTDSQKEDSLGSDNTSCQKSDTTEEQAEKVTGESQNSEECVSVRPQEDTESNCTGFPEGGLPKVPSIGRIGQLDSLEFAQLLGNEASRLAEEFMNCSCDSGLPDSDDSSSVKCTSSTSNMDHSSKAAHLDENVNPFLKNSRLARSPPLGKRGAVCGAESVDNSDAMDTFKPRRSLRREEVLGEDRQDTSSVEEDSGIVMPTRADLEAEVNHSEAGPEIATGLTSSDLRCASQFFKEASEMERQFRRNLSTPMGSQSKLSGDEVTPIKEKPEHPSVTPESPQNKPVPSTSTPIPPREERSAPEGTSSPTPRPSDTSEHKPSSSRPLSVPADGYVTTAEVEELLKRQSLQFEEKLLRAELAAGEKERKLIQAMKEEQKDKGSVAELSQSRDALLKMVGQYKGMLAQLVAEKEKDKQGAEERIKALEVERNQALDDLANVENAFSDVHRKYERTKQVVDTLRRNEETLRGAISDYESKLQKQEQKFVEFQKHAEEKIQLANEEFETMRKANEQEMTKMAALLKKAEMKIVSLQDAFDRKTRENQELTQLCDDLINKVGGTN